MRKAIMLLLSLSLVAMAQKPKVAVGAIGEEPEKSKALKGLSAQLTKAIVKSGEYTAVDRSEAILKQLGKEHKYQRSGAVDEKQIKELGKQLGVQYMCIVESSEVMGEYMLEAKLVDVETAEIVGMGTAPSGLADMEDLMSAAESLAQQLLDKDTMGNSGGGGASLRQGRGIYLEIKGARAETITDNLRDIISENKCRAEAKAKSNSFTLKVTASDCNQKNDGDFDYCGSCAKIELVDGKNKKGGYTNNNITARAGWSDRETACEKAAANVSKEIWSKVAGKLTEACE